MYSGMNKCGYFGLKSIFFRLKNMKTNKIISKNDNPYIKNVNSYSLNILLIIIAKTATNCVNGKTLS
jgi:hypothetical protein